MLKVGERAPEFPLPEHNGRDTSLTSLLNSGALILWFFSGYPTPANVVAARKIGQLHAELQRQGLVVAGVSPQSPSVHLRVRDRHGLAFTLLSDMQKSVAQMYEVNGLLGIGVRRGTYLISRGRVILGSVLEPIRIGRHLAFMREAPELLLGMPAHF
jgi:thioredoxin-dependent peroxiredoxin